MKKITVLLVLITIGLLFAQNKGVSLKFDAANQSYINIGNSATLKPTEGLTVTAVIKHNFSVDAEQSIISNTESGGYGIEIKNSAGNGPGKFIHGIVRRNGSYGRVKFDASTLPANEWVSIVLTYGGTYTRLYINGEEKHVNNAGGTYPIQYNNSNSTLIGAQAGTGSTADGEYYTGLIDDIKIFDYVFDNPNLASNYDATASWAGLKANYQFNQGYTTGPNTLESTLMNVTNANHGNLINFPLTTSSATWQGESIVQPRSAYNMELVSSSVINSPAQATATVKWQRGTGARWIVFAKKTAQTDYTPVLVDNTAYSVGQQIGSSSWYCMAKGVYDNETTESTITGLAGNSAYRICVYDYNYDYNSVYNYSEIPYNAVNNPISITTADFTAPSSQVSDLTSTAGAAWAATLSWNKAGATKSVIFAREVSASMPDILPANNTTYTADGVYGNATPSNGWYCVYNGGISQTTVSGLVAGKTYRFKIFGYHGSAGLEKYNKTVSAANTNNYYNNYTAPSQQASSLMSSNTLSQTHLTFNWIIGNGTRRALFLKEGSSGTPTLQNNKTYWPSSNFNNGAIDESGTWRCVFNGSTNSIEVSNLKPNTTYRAMVVEYNGTNGEEKYLTITTSTNPLNSSTSDFTVPILQSENIVLSSAASGRSSIQWTSGSGTGRVVFVKKFSTAPSGTDEPQPVNNTTYTADSLFLSGSQIGSSGWYCAYNGNGSQCLLKGLVDNTYYKVKVLDYNGSTGYEKYNLTAKTNNPLVFLHSVSSINDLKPITTELSGCYPNPFNPAATIVYSLGKESEVDLSVYDVCGRLVYNQVENRQSGNYSTKFDGTNLSSGLYFCVMKVDGAVAGQLRLNLLK